MKRLFSFVLAIVMIFSMTAFAGAVDTDYSDAASHLAALDILKGDGKGNLMLDQNVTRYQAALFFVQALTGKTDVEIWNSDKTSSVFSDVTEYGTAIDYAYGIKLILGRGNGTYGANDPITYQDMLVMAVRALGYETADMSYPYGYILAADKLGLTDDIDLVNYKANLTRGETAQIMWNMLGTEVAYVDPITGNILYPNETGLTGAVTDTTPERVTLLTKAGYTSDELAFTVVEFIPADTKDEESVDKVKLDNGWVIDAADLGITADTPKVTYLGLGGTMFINCDKSDFEAKYADGDANIVVYDFDNYTTVTNLSDKIRYTDGVLSIDGVKFKDYAISFRTFGTKGWVDAATAVTTDLFVYDSKDGYDVNTNPYCSVAYRTYTDEDKNDYVEILYTEFAFGQYVERELKYNPTGTNETFVLIGEFTEAGAPNLDGDTTYFAEKTVDGKSISKSMSKLSGEKSLNVVVDGVGIESGDLMVYNYNSVDNILTVYENCGAIETGRMTGRASDNSTVTINKVKYSVNNNKMINADFDSIIKNIEAGQDNVQYLVVNDEVVFLQSYKGETATSTYDFAVITMAEDIMTEVYGKNYSKSVKDGLYIVDGKVAVAGLDLTTGKWVPFYIDGVAINYDKDTNEFRTVVDVAVMASWADITDIAGDKSVDYADAKAVAMTTGIVSVIESDDNVYTIAAKTNITFCENTTGLTFNTEGRTNKITSDEDVDAVRIDTNTNTVIVAIDNNGVHVRTGVQGPKKNIDKPVVYYAATSNLIVLTTSAVPANWATGSALSAEETYYVVMPDYSVEYEAVADDEYSFTVNGLFDLKTNTIADPVVMTGDTMVEYKYNVGDILYMNTDGNLEVSNKTIDKAVLEILRADNENWFIPTKIDFVDNESITIDDIVKADTAISAINGTVITIDITDYDWSDYDESTFYVKGETFDADKYDGVVEINVAGKVRYSYQVNLDTVIEFNEPTVGVFSNFEYDMNGIAIYHIDNDEYFNLFTSTIYTFACYDKDTTTVDLYVVKLIQK